MRITPIWLAYATLDAFVLYYNYLSASGYVGESFKKCFEESYCFAIIELINRNLGPFTALVCTMFYGRRHKEVSLAGTERVLSFIQDTDQDVSTPLSLVAKYYSVAVIVAYCARLWLYTAVLPATVVVMFCVNALGQTALYNLAMFQYYVLGRGYARINRLLEAEAATRQRVPAPATGPLAARVACLAGTYDELGRLVNHLNQAYALGLLLRWPYTIVRLIMLVFHIIEYAAVARAGHGQPMSNVAVTLIVEHVGEILMFLQQLIMFCVTGTRLSDEINIFWIQASARKVNATVGGFIFINMDLMKAVCGTIATYFLVLIQFKFQKDVSKPLHISS